VFYSPTLKRQIAAYETGGAQSAEFQELGARGRMIGIVLAVIVIAILILMVVKPSFAIA
jgi:MFS superfamily sulfate permease-like transporter